MTWAVILALGYIVELGLGLGFLKLYCFQAMTWAVILALGCIRGVIRIGLTI
jgi:hypothetical protein